METKLKTVAKDSADPEAAFRAMVKAADVMDATPEARALARKFLTENGDAWRTANKITDAALVGFIEAMNSPGLTKEVFLLEGKRMKKELTTEKDGALEKLLIDQVVLAWIRLTYVEQLYTGVLYGSESITLERGMYWEKRLNAAQKRFSLASSSLARVRGLLQSPRVKNLNVVAVNAMTASNANYGTDRRSIANGRR